MQPRILRRDRPDHHITLTTAPVSPESGNLPNIVGSIPGVRPTLSTGLAIRPASRIPRQIGQLAGMPTIKPSLPDPVKDRSLRIRLEKST
ncbi:hypothetical protein [Novacetimonas pomaceti]|uniref:hypothetical protein n=1 Tax=Novacetimonas pomaceti TaxID=2021998 RepID=UPI001C2CC830|nr:hypothetical protein [Novacetimonas pomaceti]MBV1833344.1 hypothetical protein [Novacetimonas pomaceti]